MPYPLHLEFHPILHELPEVLPRDNPTYLVGGAVRDAFLRRTSNDLDFIVPTGAMEIARQVADKFHGHFYPLDFDRDYGRAIVRPEEGERVVLDFTPFQGSDLESDLLGRDFTINSLAVEVHDPNQLIDPLGGLSDLYSRTIRACSKESIAADPIRVLRAVRLAVALEMKIEKETRQQLRAAAPLLAESSAERIRDEIFRMLGGPRAGAALRVLDQLEVIATILPEILELKGVDQSEPHMHDVWEHTLGTLDALESLLAALSAAPNPETYSNLYFGLASIKLGRYRDQIQKQLAIRMTPERSLRSLIFFAALFHDIGKPLTRQVEENGRIRFFEHEKVGARLAGETGHRLQLSNSEISRLKTIVFNHLRPLWLAQANQEPGRRAIYRFFRSTEDAGVDICLLSLADMVATYGPGLPQDRWVQLLETIRPLLQTWWEGPKEIVKPESLITGSDLISEFSIEPGPEIGRILEALREAQAAGQVTTRLEALEFAASLIGKKIDFQG